MLVVISIIAILSSILAGGYVNSQKSARDAARKLNLKSIADALNAYYADYGFYPEDTDLRDSQNAFAKNGVTYMKLVPHNTNLGQLSDVLYKVPTITPKKSFRLFTNLENEEDKDCFKRSVCSLLGYSISNDCCYIITSSNVGITEAFN